MTDVEFPTVDGSRACLTGLVSVWHVGDGERVEPGRVVAEVELGDVETEVLAPAAGVLRHLVSVDEISAQGVPIARVEQAEE
ncbi:biotin/lipoyl-containing protein [Georgenia subflava]|nr:biotin/lipoyl-containing protein [Georgenia subflava]